MKQLSGVILLCCACWMTIYLYGEYASDSARFHETLWIFPLLMYILSFGFFYSAYKGTGEKSAKIQKQEEITD